MQSNYNNPLHNPEGVGEIDNTATNPGDTSDTDTAEAATTNNPLSDCVRQLENQVKQLSMALLA